jgi:hypothetical protein
MIDHAEFLDRLADAKGYAQQAPRGVVWVVVWPGGHITIETTPVLLKCNRTKIVEVTKNGELFCA